MNRRFTDDEIKQKAINAITKQKHFPNTYFIPPGKPVVGMTLHNEAWDTLTFLRIPFDILTQGTFRFVYLGSQVTYYVRTKKYKIDASGEFRESRGLLSVLESLRKT